MPRRGKGEGSICQRSDGRWMARIDIGHDASGKRLTKTIYGPTKKSVADKLTQEASALLTGTTFNSGKMTVADLLTKWLTESAKQTTGIGTYNRYKQVVESHLIPRIGSIKLSAIRALHIQALMSNLEKAEVGVPTRRYCFATLRRAFVVAIRWQLLARNPSDGVDIPKLIKRQVRPLTPKQAQALIEATEGGRYHALFVVAVTTGLRQGELFGLQWESVDLKKGTITVKHSLEEIGGVLRLKEPKSDAGRRQVALPKIAVDALAKRQAAAMAEGQAGCSYVFPNGKGGPLRKSNFQYEVWNPLRESVKIGDELILSGKHFHDLRHSCASMMLADGVNVKAIQTILGHSTITLTLDTYSHLLPNAQADAANRFDRLLSSKIG